MGTPEDVVKVKRSYTAQSELLGRRLGPKRQVAAEQLAGPEVMRTAAASSFPVRAVLV